MVLLCQWVLAQNWPVVKQYADRSSTVAGGQSGRTSLYRPTPRFPKAGMLR